MFSPGVLSNKIMLNRLYHTSCVTHSFKKQSVKLAKMLNPRPTRNAYTVKPFDSVPSIKSLTKVEREPGKSGLRRLAMLNKLFMKNITDLMSTGTIAMNVVGQGIEVSKVHVSKDFKTVSVFWVCKGGSSDADTEVLLSKIAGPLRHELSSLRLIGEVPYIVFVKDEQEAKVVELDRRLAIADFGEDYTPTQLGHILKSEFTLNMKLSPEMKAKIKQIEEEMPLSDELIPEMTNNVYGLDHAKIMNRLLAARKKSKDAWVNLDVDAPVISYRATTTKQSDKDIGNQKKELAEFLLQRKILLEKLSKQERKHRSHVLAVDDKDEDLVDPNETSMEDEDDDEMYESEDNYFYRVNLPFQLQKKDNPPV